MIAAAHASRRIVQAGLQQRSGAHFRSAVEYVQSGKLGRVHVAKAWTVHQRKSIGFKKDVAVPAGVDYDLWLGPAAARPFNPNRFHYNWHWNWDYGTGELGNNGIHALDVVRWLLDLDAPTRVSAGGGKLFYDDDQETPDTQLAVFEVRGPTSQASIQWEHRTWSPRGIDGEAFGVEFYGSQGTLVTNGRGWVIYEGAGKNEKAAARHEASELERAHKTNFLDCIVSRERPNADVEIAHRSTLLCHLANIAWRTRSVLQFDKERETITGNAAAALLMGRSYRKGFELPVIA
jgi:predicted dehydrogenase